MRNPPLSSSACVRSLGHGGADYDHQDSMCTSDNWLGKLVVATKHLNRSYLQAMAPRSVLQIRRSTSSCQPTPVPQPVLYQEHEFAAL